jgi:hypothetical protein
VYSAEKACADVVEACDSVGINIATMVVCLQGDNVDFNTKLAELLGVARGKCLPHAISLLVRHGFKELKLGKDLLVSSAGILTAGGTNKRRVELLTKFDVNGTKCAVYTNRFASVVAPAKYVLTVYSKWRRYWLEGATVPKDDDAGGSDDEDDSPLKRVTRVKAAIGKLEAATTVALIDVMYGEAAEAVPLLSASGDHVAPATLTTLDRVGKQLEATAKNLASATLMVNQAIAKVEASTAVPYNVSEKNTIVTRLVPQVTAAAQASLESFNKHIRPMLEGLLRYRQVYDVRIKPVLPPDNKLTKEYFGALAADFGVQLQLDYKSYATGWGDIDFSAFPRSYDFWKSKAAEWPVLSKVARWWLSVPTSSILAERTFALGRVISVPARASMSWATFESELKLKVQQAVVKKLMQDTGKLLKVC